MCRTGRLQGLRKLNNFEDCHSVLSGLRAAALFRCNKIRQVRVYPRVRSGSRLSQLTNWYTFMQLSPSMPIANGSWRRS